MKFSEFGTQIKGPKALWNTFLGLTGLGQGMSHPPLFDFRFAHCMPSRQVASVQSLAYCLKEVRCSPNDAGNAAFFHAKFDSCSTQAPSEAISIAVAIDIAVPSVGFIYCDLWMLYKD